MVRRLIACLAGIGLLAFTGVAQAQDDDPSLGLYAALGLELFNADLKGSDNGTPYSLTTRPLAIIGRVGYKFLPWVGVELYGGSGIHDDENDGRVGTGQPIRNGDTKLKYIVGGAVKPQYTYNFADIRPITFFLVGGYSTFKLDGDVSNQNNGNFQARFSRDEDDFYYGGGLQLEGEVASFQLQYVDYSRGGGVDVSGYQISINKYF